MEDVKEILFSLKLIYRPSETIKDTESTEEQTFDQFVSFMLTNKSSGKQCGTWIGSLEEAGKIVKHARSMANIMLVEEMETFAIGHLGK